MIFNSFFKKIYNKNIVVFCSAHMLTNATITMVIAVLGTCKIHVFSYWLPQIFPLWKLLKITKFDYISFYSNISQHFSDMEYRFVTPYTDIF